MLLKLVAVDFDPILRVVMSRSGIVEVLAEVAK